APSLPLIPLAPKARQTSAAIADCARARQRLRQSLDRAPAPAGKTCRRDRRRLRPECFHLGETHTPLLKKDRKLPCHPFGRRPTHGIRSAKGSPATSPRFLLQPPSPPVGHPCSDGRSFSPKDACRRVRRSTAHSPELYRPPFARCLRVRWPHRVRGLLSSSLLACFDTSPSKCAK